MNPKVKKIVDKINSEGVDSVLPYFNDNYETLLKYLMWGNALEELDIDKFDDSSIVYTFMLNNGMDNKVIKHIIENMSSISHDGNDYYYELRDLSELADWFSGRDYGYISPRDVAGGILSEDWWEPFSFSRGDINLMRDVYDDLTKENRQILRNIVVQRYGNFEFEVHEDDVTNTIREIGTETEDGSYVFTITNENVMELFSDDDTMNYMFNETYLEEIASELYILFNDSYNGAYQSEYYSKVWDELKGNFIDPDAKPIEFQYGKKMYVKLKITQVLPYLIKKYIMGNYCEDIDRLGAYEYLIEEGFRCDAWEKLSFGISDYPDSSMVRKLLNENFNSNF